MLVVDRKVGERIAIGAVVIEIGAARDNRAELKIEFPPELSIRCDGIEFNLTERKTEMGGGAGIYREIELSA